MSALSLPGQNGPLLASVESQLQTDCGRLPSAGRVPEVDPVLSLNVFRRMTAAQREEPVGSSARTHGVRHQADFRFGDQRWPSGSYGRYS